MEMLDEEHQPLPQLRSDTNIYNLGSINSHNVVIAGLPKAGNCLAATVITQMKMTFPNLKYGLLVGIGGGVPVKTDHGMVRLGHVVVSEPTGIHSGAVQYDHGKARAGEFERKGSLAPPPTALLNAAREVAVRRQRIDYDPIWENTKRIETSRRPLRRFKFPGATNDHLYLPDYEHQQVGMPCEEGGCDPKQRIERPIDDDDSFVVVHRGTIASGELVIKDAKKRDVLAREHGVLCFEMEAAGALADFPCMVIRGISDYCDSHKNDVWHGYAAAVAAAYARQLLFHMPIEHYEDSAAHFLVPYTSNPDFVGRSADNSRDPEYNRHVRIITEKCILGLLEFPTMNDRYIAIETAHRSVVHAHKSTFDWIFDRPGPGFVDWLQKGDGVFWINGKAGSGKSTLMKFIADDERLIRYLNGSRASLGHVMRVDFYFWASGSSDQRALSGLLRTFLYRVLSQAGELMPDVFPEQWTRLHSAASDRLSEFRAEEMEKLVNELQELKQEMERLVNELQGLKQQMGERVKQLQELKQERERSVNELQELKQRVGERVKQLQNDIRGREARVKQLQNDIRERETLVKQLQNEIQERGTLVEQLQNEIQEREALVKQLQNEIQEREALVKQLQNEIQEREALVKQLQNEIQRRDGAWMAEIAYQRATDKVIRQLSGDGRWTQDDLLQRFHDILAKLSSSRTLFLLVDGLDEYGATEEEMEDLVNLLKNAGQRPNSKICVSTRPFAIFENNFGRQKYPCLRLQDLTSSDIRMFVKDAFDQSSLMEITRNANPSLMPDFYSIIVRKAEGVFLWVRLVVKMLLRGLNHGDDFLELRRMVAELPEDLERLYRHMFDSIETKNWEKSSKIFSIVNAAQEPPTALTVWFSGESTADPLESLSEETKAARCYVVCLRLMNQCAGLLELRRTNIFYDDDDDDSDDDDDHYPGEALMDDDLLQPIECAPQQQHYLRSTVHYMHRTAKDFLNSTVIKDLIKGRLENRTKGMSFDPHKWLALQTLVKLRHFMGTKPSFEDEELFFDNNGALKFISDRNLQHIDYLKNMVGIYSTRCMDKAIATRLRSAAEEICCGDWSEDSEFMTQSTEQIDLGPSIAGSSKRRTIQGQSLPMEAGCPQRSRGTSDINCLKSPPTGRTVNNAFDKELRSLLQEDGVKFGRKSPLKRH
ncbi:hypothetical protein FOBRF1_013661 [Fusarium oxysporum]